MVIIDDNPQDGPEVSINGGYPLIAGWLRERSQSKMDDLGVPPFMETTKLFIESFYA